MNCLIMELITMLNVLVTGKKGQVASEIKELSHNYAYNFFFTDRDELDIKNQDEIQSFIKKNAINIIINCAAYTAVDKAEEEQ
ncbi:MAG: dTDP-4-dehydrorhamnose reductase, partial [uncultured Sulfurovum sp.]